jgi:hypothetical protein
MSAIALAPNRSAPGPRHGTNPERGVLRLVRSTRSPLRPNSSLAHLIETWDRVLDATEQALNAAEMTKVLPGPELSSRRQRLSEERRWLVRLKELGPCELGDTSVWPGDTFGISTLSPGQVVLS